MRKNRWIASVWGMLAAAALGHTAGAQPPASPLEGPFPPAGPVAPGPMAYPGQPTYTPVAPDAASPAGFPPQMEAWPTISPFEHAFEQTYNDDGIWFRQVLNHQRRYQVNVEFISAKFKAPGHTAIGADSVIAIPKNRYGEPRGGIAPFDINTVKDGLVFSGQGRYLSEDADITPDSTQSGPVPRVVAGWEIRAGGNQIGGDGDTDQTTTDLTFIQPKAGLLQIVNFEGGTPDETIDFASEVAKTVLYPVSGGVLDEDAVTRFGGDPDVVGERRRNPSSPGLRISFGLEEEDDTGFLWSGYWINGQPTVFRRGLDDPSRPVVTNIVFFEAPHLGTGINSTETGDANIGLGYNTPAVEVLDYNTLFEVTHETEAAGTDLAFYHTPIVDLGWFRMRPLYGARYDYIRETFSFTGRDNGFAYAFDQDGDTFSGDETSDFVGGDGVLSSDEVPRTLTDPVNLTHIFPYETTALSKVRSHLYGPQIGFDMQAGGEYLMLSAVTKTGVVVNTEKLTLDTAGFGSDEALTGHRTFESDSKTHTRLAPFLEFNANADINVFPIIPVVNRWNVLKNARIRAGWTALVFGNMQRPLDQIGWRSQQSGGAYIRERGRDVWYTQYWNVGVHWNF